MATCPGAPAGRGGRWALPTVVATPRAFEPPTNLTPALARALSPLPYSEVCNVHLTGSAIPLTVWYRLTAVANQYQIGFQASPEALSSYNPTVAVFTGTPGSLTAHLTLSEVVGPFQMPVTPGVAYFFEVAHVGPEIPVGGVFLTISTKVSLNVLAPSGSVLINDDLVGFPLVALSASGAGVLQTRPFPSGETGAALPNGISLWHNREDADHLYLYDATMTLIATPAWARADSDPPPITTNGADTFYVGDSRSGGAHIRTVSDTGQMGPTTWVLPHDLIYHLGVSPDETIAYYRGTPLNDGPIHRYDLDADAALSDLVAAVPGTQHAGEVLTLGDGSTFVGYRVSGTDYVKRYAPDGSELNTYPMPGADMQINRLSRALTDASFWVWLWGTGPDAGIDTFVHIQVSDGAYLEQFTSNQYSSGIFLGPIESTSVDQGHAVSCPFIIYPPDLPPYDGGELLPEPEPLPACVTAPPLASCWAPHDLTVLQIGLIAEDSQP